MGRFVLSGSGVLSAVQPSRTEARVALGAALVSLAVLAGLAPFAKLPLARVEAFWAAAISSPRR
jgi:hypothetical protein